MTLTQKLFAVLLLSLSTLASATDWQVIRHPYFNLIFDRDIEADARRTASRLSVYLEQHLDELPIERGLPPTDIVLYTGAHISNGSVGIFPYRSQWYNRPAPFAQLEWFDVLAVHEGRHIVQFNQSRDSGWSRLVSLLFGEVGTGAMLLLLPDWYLEGDATVSETTLTEGGRGRVASFDLWYRTDLLTEDAYDYERAMLGTGFDRLPYIGPYVLGYFFSGYLRTTYGDDIFDATIDELGQWNGSFFSTAIKDRTGKDLDELYNDMLDELTAQWRSELERTPVTTVEHLSQSADSLWLSHYPISADTETQLALSIGLTQRPKLTFTRGSQGEVSVEVPAAVARAYRSGSKTRAISHNGSQTCWILDRPALIQPNTSFGDLQCLDSKAHINVLTKGDRLTGVAVWENGFIAHRFDAQRQSSLVWFDQHGQEKATLALPAHSLATDLIVQDNQLLYVLSSSNGQNGIYSIALNEQTQPRQLIAANQESLRAPVLTDNWLIYTSDLSGRDQLMAQHRTTGARYQIAHRPFGAYYPVWNDSDQQLVFADYQPNGMQIAALSFDDMNSPEESWIPVKAIPSRTVWVDDLIPNTPPPTEPDQHSWAIEDYSVAGNLWNPYSWAVSSDGSTLGANVRSLDTLNRLALSADVGYDFSQSQWSADLAAQYRLNAGPWLGGHWQRTADYTDLSVSIQQPAQLQWTLASSQLSAELAARQRWPVSGNEHLLLQAGASANYVRERAMQAIETPFGLSQSVKGVVNTRSQAVSGLSETHLALSGWHTRQAINGRVATQWLNEQTPLIRAIPIFSTPDTQGLTVQTDVDYRINLGPVGQGFGSLVYWRNTEVSLNARLQQSETETETALGLSLSPSLNLFRNAMLLATPQVSVYYLPSSREFALAFSARLANF